MLSLLNKLRKLRGLIDTSDANEFENKFLKSVVPVAISKAELGQVATLSDKQLAVIERIYDKHFA